MVNNISNQTMYNVANSYSQYSSKKTDTKDSAENKETSVSSKPSNSNDRKTSSERKSSINSILSQAENKAKNFEILISSTFKKQSNKSLLVSYASSNQLKNFFSNLKVDASTIAKAKKDISEDGYYGVKQTSERILSLAKAVAGNDPKKLQEMRDAVEKGFKNVERMWGGELPEISQQTYEKVMSTFDELQGKI